MAGIPVLSSSSFQWILSWCSFKFAPSLNWVPQNSHLTVNSDSDLTIWPTKLDSSSSFEFSFLEITSIRRTNGSSDRGTCQTNTTCVSSLRNVISILLITHNDKIFFQECHNSTMQNERSSEIFSPLLQQGEKLVILVWDATEVNVERSCNHRLGKSSFSSKHKSHAYHRWVISKSRFAIWKIDLFLCLNSNLNITLL